MFILWGAGLAALYCTALFLLREPAEQLLPLPVEAISSQPFIRFGGQICDLLTGMGVEQKPGERLFRWRPNLDKWLDKFGKETIAAVTLTGLVLLALSLGFKRCKKLGYLYAPIVLVLTVFLHFFFERNAVNISLIYVAGLILLAAIIPKTESERDVLAQPTSSIPALAKCGSLHIILLTAALLAGWGLRFYVLAVHPYGYAGHGVDFLNSDYHLLQQIIHGTTEPYNRGIFLNFIHYFFHTGQSFIGIFDFITFTVFGVGFLQQRLMAAIIGVLTIPLLYYVGMRLFGRTEGALAAFLLAVSPWHIAISRYEGCYQIQSLPYELILILLVLWALRHGGWWRFAGGGLWAGLAIHLYSANFILPLIMAGYLCLLWLPWINKEFNRPKITDFLSYLAAASLFVIERLWRSHLLPGVLFDTRITPGFKLTSGLVEQNATDFLMRLFFYSDDMHIVKLGPILTMLISVFFIVGLGFSCRRIRNHSHLLLLLSTFGGILPAILSEAAFPRRFFNILPFICLISAKAVVTGLDWLNGATNIFWKTGLLLFTILGLLSVTAADSWIYFTNVKSPESDLGYAQRLTGVIACREYYDRAVVYSLNSALYLFYYQIFCNKLIEKSDEVNQWLKQSRPTEFLFLLTDPAFKTQTSIVAMIRYFDPARLLTSDFMTKHFPSMRPRLAPENEEMVERTILYYLTPEQIEVARIVPEIRKAAMKIRTREVEVAWNNASGQEFQSAQLLIGRSSGQQPISFEAESMSPNLGAGSVWSMEKDMSGFSGEGYIYKPGSEQQQLVLSMTLDHHVSGSIWIHALMPTISNVSLQIDDNEQLLCSVKEEAAQWRFIGGYNIDLSSGRHEIQFKSEGMTGIDLIVLLPEVVDPPSDEQIISGLQAWQTLFASEWIPITGQKLPFQLPAEVTDAADLEIKLRLSKGDCQTGWSKAAKVMVQK